MHEFDELIQHCTAFSLEALGAAEQRAVEALETSDATGLVKALQMVQLQRVIFAVGMFSIFEAELQDDLNAAEGFLAADEVLASMGEVALAAQFRDMKLAVNVLKHGRGRSYDALLARAESLPFRIKRHDEYLFNEGDVGEVRTLIEVDDVLVKRCADIIHVVANALRRRPLNTVGRAVERSS